MGEFAGGSWFGGIMTQGMEYLLTNQYTQMGQGCFFNCSRGQVAGTFSEVHVASPIKYEMKRNGMNDVRKLVSQFGVACRSNKIPSPQSQVNRQKPAGKKTAGRLISRCISFCSIPSSTWDQFPYISGKCRNQPFGSAFQASYQESQNKTCHEIYLHTWFQCYTETQHDIILQYVQKSRCMWNIYICVHVICTCKCTCTCICMYVYIYIYVYVNVCSISCWDIICIL